MIPDVLYDVTTYHIVRGAAALVAALPPHPGALIMIILIMIMMNINNNNDDDNDNNSLSNSNCLVRDKWGHSTNGVTAKCKLFDRGTFWALPLANFYLPKSARAYLFPNLSEFSTFAAAPLASTPFVRNQLVTITKTIIIIIIVIMIVIIIIIIIIIVLSRGSSPGCRSTAAPGGSSGSYYYYYYYYY